MRSASGLHGDAHRVSADDPALDPLERRLAARPRIVVPTVVLESADDGVDPPAEPEPVRAHFADVRLHAPLKGIGHNLPQERPPTPSPTRS